MSDRELLELAAKAAGVPLKWPHDPVSYARVDGVSPRRTDTWDNWSPLTDDGDALRLAVKLRMRVQVLDSARGECVRAELLADKPREFWESSGDRNGDPYAATRRAIVRAAAEIGRAM